MDYNPGAVNRFGFNTQQTIYESAADENIPLTPAGSQNVLLNATANISLQLPNPALCLDQTRTITNLASLNTVAVHQYNATTAYSGAVIALPGVAGGTLQAGTSAVAGPAPKYSSATYYCNGSTWLLQSASVNHYA